MKPLDIRCTTAHVLLLTAVALWPPRLLYGWGAPGHRTITARAVSLLPDDAPQWMRSDEAVELASYQSNEPDRWRGTPLPELAHENSADHYIDLELLDEYGLTISTLPRLRYRFVEAVVRAEAGRAADDDGRGVMGFAPERIGYLPYAIAEHYAKLTSSLNTVRILEALDDPTRERQMQAARANVLREMGQLSHFVGDAGQPLHTTIHHHGWVGENPCGYTTDPGFHSYIDSGIVALHALNTTGLRPRGATPAPIAAEEIWDASIALIERSFAGVEPLYELDRSAALREDAGRAFITERMADAASVLAGLYHRAWLEAEPTPRQIEDFVRYNDHRAERRGSPGEADPGR